MQPQAVESARSREAFVSNGFALKRMDYHIGCMRTLSHQALNK